MKECKLLSDDKTQFYISPILSSSLFPYVQLGNVVQCVHGSLGGKPHFKQWIDKSTFNY